jgi:hypothetical protein
MREFIDRIQGLWCETVHGRAMWPIHGSYRCATCQREYPVGFEQTVGIPPAGRTFPDRHRGGFAARLGVVLGAHAVDSTFPRGAQR